MTLFKVRVWFLDGHTLCAAKQMQQLKNGSLERAAVGKTMYQDYIYNRRTRGWEEDLLFFRPVF